MQSRTKKFLLDICSILGHDLGYGGKSGWQCDRCGIDMGFFVSNHGFGSIKNLKVTLDGNDMKVSYDYLPTFPVSYVTVTFNNVIV